MPVYVYQSLDGLKQYEFLQKISDPPLSEHPESGEKIKKVIVPGAGVIIPGIKKGARIDKKSPAATACGCAKKGLHHHHH